MVGLSNLLAFTFSGEGACLCRLLGFLLVKRLSSSYHHELATTTLPAKADFSPQNLSPQTIFLRKIVHQLIATTRNLMSWVTFW